MMTRNAQNDYVPKHHGAVSGNVIVSFEYVSES